jgi:hypothetical protein
MKKFCLILLLSGLFGLYSFTALAQYPDTVGSATTTAMHYDSSAFIGWAKTCVVIRGFVNISDTTFLYNGTNKATYGDAYYGVGIANDSVVSLGDGGIAILTFDPPVANGPGFDFAVFENSYSNTFLELAFVEVSSDGVKYVRFPAVSLTRTDVQVGTFGVIDATKINNLAGKYRAKYGTPFDLQDLADSSGLDMNHITNIKIIDAVGCIQPAYATYDYQGHIVNDPFPTPFWSSGFDLDAVGVIHTGPQAIGDQDSTPKVQVWPNPVSSFLNVIASPPSGFMAILSDISGRIILSGTAVNGKLVLDLSGLPRGIYLLSLAFPDGETHIEKVIRL